MTLPIRIVSEPADAGGKSGHDSTRQPTTFCSKRNPSIDGLQTIEQDDTHAFFGGADGGQTGRAPLRAVPISICGCAFKGCASTTPEISTSRGTVTPRMGLPAAVNMKTGPTLGSWDLETDPRPDFQSVPLFQGNHTECGLMKIRGNAARIMCTCSVPGGSGGFPCLGKYESTNSATTKSVCLPSGHLKALHVRFVLRPLGHHVPPESGPPLALGAAADCDPISHGLAGVTGGGCTRVCMPIEWHGWHGACPAPTPWGACCTPKGGGGLCKAGISAIQIL